MPEEHRASHTAARNRGVYPHNGAMRLRMEQSCAERVLEVDGEWAHVVVCVPRQGESIMTESNKSARPLPAHLGDAYDWTDAAGELETFAGLHGAALDRYIQDSADNAREHDASVSESELRELHTWLRAAKVGKRA